MTRMRFDIESMKQVKIPKGLKVVTELLPGGFFLAEYGQRFTVMRVRNEQGQIRNIGQDGGWAPFKKGVEAIADLQDTILRHS